MLSAFGNLISIHQKLSFRNFVVDTCIEHSVNEDIGVSSNGRCKVRVYRRVQRIMTILRNIEHACAEVFGPVHGSGGQNLQAEFVTVLPDLVEGGLDIARRNAVKVEAEAFGTFDKGFHPPRNRWFMSTQ